MTQEKKYELEVVNIRLVKEPSLYSEKKLDVPRNVVELMSGELAQYDRELACVLNMNTSRQVINMSIVSIGTLNLALVSPREVFKSSILSNAAAIILMHNHPSGSISPSRQDKLLTQRFFEAGKLMDIELLDHVIVGGTSGEMFSFREEGYLKMENGTEQLYCAERIGRSEWER